MQTLIYVMIFIFGTILGSGLNALAYRLETDTSWTRGRSRCPHCDHELSWWELLPLVSFLLLRRRCSDCGQKISFQYPLVELAAGGLLLLSYSTFGATIGTLLAAATGTILLFIYVFDARTMLIPNPAVWSFNLLAFTGLFLNFNSGFSGQVDIFTLPGWWALAAGPLVAAPLFFIWLLSRGRAMGFGDVKLALGIGWMLGIVGGLSALTYAFWIGAVVSVGLLAHQQLWKSPSPEDVEAHTIEEDGIQDTSSDETNPQLSLKSAVPFGPFLILGWLIVLFSGVTLF